MKRVSPVSRHELDLLGVAEHRRRDGAAERDVEALPVAGGVGRGEAGEAGVDAAFQRAARLHVVERRGRAPRRPPSASASARAEEQRSSAWSSSSCWAAPSGSGAATAAAAAFPCARLDCAPATTFVGRLAKVKPAEAAKARITASCAELFTSRGAVPSARGRADASSRSRAGSRPRCAAAAASASASRPHCSACQVSSIRESSQAASAASAPRGDREPEHERARERDELVERGEPEGVLRRDGGAQRREARGGLRRWHDAGHRDQRRVERRAPPRRARGPRPAAWRAASAAGRRRGSRAGRSSP